MHPVEECKTHLLRGPVFVTSSFVVDSMATAPQMSPRAAPPSRALARLAVSLIPPLLAERCPVDFTLMSSESPPLAEMLFAYSEGIDRVYGGLLPLRDFCCPYGGEPEVVEFRQKRCLRPALHLAYRPDRLALTFLGVPRCLVWASTGRPSDGVIVLKGVVSLSMVMSVLFSARDGHELERQ